MSSVGLCDDRLTCSSGGLGRLPRPCNLVCTNYTDEKSSFDIDFVRCRSSTFDWKDIDADSIRSDPFPTDATNTHNHRSLNGERRSSKPRVTASFPLTVRLTLVVLSRTKTIETRRRLTFQFDQRGKLFAVRPLSTRFTAKTTCR